MRGALLLGGLQDCCSSRAAAAPRAHLSRAPVVMKDLSPTMACSSSTDSSPCHTVHRTAPRASRCVMVLVDTSDDASEASPSLKSCDHAFSPSPPQLRLPASREHSCPSFFTASPAATYGTPQSSFTAGDECRMQAHASASSSDEDSGELRFARSVQRAPQARRLAVLGDASDTSGSSTVCTPVQPGVPHEARRQGRPRPRLPNAARDAAPSQAVSQPPHAPLGPPCPQPPHPAMRGRAGPHFLGSPAPADSPHSRQRQGQQLQHIVIDLVSPASPPSPAHSRAGSTVDGQASSTDEGASSYSSSLTAPANREASSSMLPPPKAPQPGRCTPAAPPSRVAPHAAPARKTNRMTAQEKAFTQEREALARALYASWNAAVFGGRLPADLPLVWNPRLAATAGQVMDDGSRNSEKTCKEQRLPCRLELSSRLLLSSARLRSTLGHEMCHVAAWVVDREWGAPHGPAFWRWANALMAHDAQQQQARAAIAPPRGRFVVGSGRDGGAGWARLGVASEDGDGDAGGAGGEEGGALVITRLHSFEAHMPHRWQCNDARCGKLYSRHRRSIDSARHQCKCGGQLVYLGRYGKNNQLLAPKAKQPATPGQGAAPGAHTPNAYALFVKENMSSIKQAHPKGTPQATIMKALGAKWTALKQQQQQQQQQVESEGTAQPRRLAIELEACKGQSGAGADSVSHELQGRDDGAVRDQGTAAGGSSKMGAGGALLVAGVRGLRLD